MGPQESRVQSYVAGEQTALLSVELSGVKVLSLCPVVLSCPGIRTVGSLSFGASEAYPDCIRCILNQRTVSPTIWGGHQISGQVAENTKVFSH